MQGVLDKLEHQVIKLRTDIQHHKKRAAKSMQAAFTLGRASHVLGKFIIDNALFPPERKDAVYDEGDLLPVYMYGKGTREDPCYFDEELSSKDDDSDKEMEDNKIDEENKENIPDNEPPKASANNEATQTLPTQEEEYSWTSDSDKHQVAIMNYIWSCQEEDYKIFDCPHYTCGECSKQAPGHRMVECKKYFCKRCQEPAPGHNW